MKMSAAKTTTSENIAEIKENTAKSLQLFTDDNLKQRATITIIFKNPDATTRTKCSFPLKVTISPLASSGKKPAISTPNNPLITKINDPIIEP